MIESVRKVSISIESFLKGGVINGTNYLILRRFLLKIILMYGLIVPSKKSVFELFVFLGILVIWELKWLYIMKNILYMKYSRHIGHSTIMFQGKFSPVQIRTGLYITVMFCHVS